MKKTYQVEVDCALCATKIESAINKMDEVKSCTVNFMTQKMIVEYDDNVNEKALFKQIKKAGRKVDSDFEVIE